MRMSEECVSDGQSLIDRCGESMVIKVSLRLFKRNAC